jgi:hypothetical protein
MSELNDLEAKSAHYKSLPDDELNEIWKNREAFDMGEDEQNMLKYILRNRLGFKPSNPHVSMCKRCNLPVDNCACMNL